MTPSQDELTGLVRLAQAGNPDALTVLLQKHEHEIYCYFLGRIGNRDEALDRTQQTLFKAWRNLSTLDDASSFKPWLYTIAKNLARDYWRAKKASSQSWEELEADIGTESMLGPEEYVIKADLVKLALAELTPKFRDSLLLQLVGGLSRHEIAARLEISERSVCTYISYARKQFRHAYARLENVSN